MNGAPLPRSRVYDTALLDETHAELHAALARYGFDSERKYRSFVVDEERDAIREEAESGVFPVVKYDRTLGSDGEAVYDSPDHADRSEDAAHRKAAGRPHVTSALSTDRNPGVRHIGARAATTDLPASSGPSAGPSSVHTLDTTRQPSVRTEEFAESCTLRGDFGPKYLDPRAPLIRQRAAATVEVRRAIVGRLRARAAELRRRARRWGFSERDIRSRRVGSWHEARARNEDAVLDVALACQKEKTMVVSCRGCGVVREAPVRCRRHFFCVGCRSKIGEEKRAKLHKSLRVLLHNAFHRRLLFRLRRGGRWSMKLFTLTAPHAERHDVVERSDVFRRALPAFERKLRAHVKALDPSNADLVHWSRSREWEPGDDGRGHPHAHYVFFGPFLDLEMARGWWASSLRSVGYEERERKGHSNFDVREARGKGAVGEVIKYVFKDIDGKGRAIGPLTFAGAYAALAGQRTTQCSRGLMKLGKVDKACTECGATKCFRTRMVDGVKDELRPGLRKARPAVELRQVTA